MRDSLNPHSGFTLTELLVAIAIMTTLIISISVGGLRVYERAQAQKIVDSFREIETAWTAWRSDTHLNYPPENTLGYTPTDPCGGSSVSVASINSTHLFSANPGGGTIDEADFDSLHWNGPYLERPAVDNWGAAFDYDNEPIGSTDTYIPANCTVAASREGNLGRGVNITLDWCNSGSGTSPGNYTRLLMSINQIVDGDEDGNERWCGKFRWNDPVTPIGRMFYMIDPQG